MTVELRIPSPGESITEVQIGQWLKAEGERVERDEAIVEIETDKASMELPAPVSGVLTKQLKPAGEIVPVGTVIALIEEQVPAGTVVTPRAAAGAAGEQHVAAGVAPPIGLTDAGLGGPALQGSAGVSPASGGAAVSPASGSAGVPPASGGVGVSPAIPTRDPRGAVADGAVRIMPAARRALAESGLPPAAVTPTGPGGRILKEDVERQAAAARAGMSAGPDGEHRAAPAATAPTGGDRLEEIVPMTMLRRRIAERLVESQRTTASLTTFNEIDMSAVLTLRRERGEEFHKQHGVKLGLMSFFVKAAIDALKRFPAVNAEIRGTDIVYKNYYDIGIAVSTDHGLVVPVVRNAERLSFAEIELAIADLAARAREKKITIEELQGGTFTITNGGVFGSLLATPIINPPQSAILGLHAIQDRAVVRDGQVVIRPMMYVALTYDHRIIDGRESVSFLKRIKECVEDPARMLIEV